MHFHNDAATRNLRLRATGAALRRPALGSPRDEVGWGDAKTPAARGCCRDGSGRRRPRFGRFGRGADALLAGQRLLRAPGPVRAGHRRRRDRVRMQATTLGSYLLYRPDRHLPRRRRATASVGAGAGAEPGGRLARRGGRRGHVHARRPHRRRDRTLTARFVAGDRLRRLPRGRRSTPPARRRRDAAATAAVGGLVEGHMHWMTFEYLGGNFHCGRPWHPYGIPYALPDCSLDRGPAGRRARRCRTSSTSATPRRRTTRSGYPKLTEWGAGQPHLRGHVLALDRARLAGAACG